MVRFILFILVGIVSSILSTWSVAYIDSRTIDENAFIPMGKGDLIGPGLVFGILIGLLYVKRTNLVNYAVFIFASTIANFLAVMLCLYLLIFGIPIAGVMGAFILLKFLDLTLKELTEKHIICMSLLGGFLSIGFFIKSFDGVIKFVFSDLPFISDYPSHFLLYFFWQVGLATALGFIEFKNKKK